jgi:hypothetical protein
MLFVRPASLHVLKELEGLSEEVELDVEEGAQIVQLLQLVLLDRVHPSMHVFRCFVTIDIVRNSSIMNERCGSECSLSHLSSRELVLAFLDFTLLCLLILTNGLDLRQGCIVR